MTVAAHNDWRQQSLHAFDRQNPNRPSMQCGLIQLPLSLLSLCSPQKCSLCFTVRTEEMCWWLGCNLPPFPSEPPQSKGVRFNLPLSTSPRCPGAGVALPNHHSWFNTTGTLPASTDGHGAGFSIRETVETTKTLPRLIQLVSLHPIKQVIFSSCSAQEPHGRARLPRQWLATLNQLFQPGCRQPTYSKLDQSCCFYSRNQALVKTSPYDEDSQPTEY